jgi:hypothetical protein
VVEEEVGDLRGGLCGEKAEAWRGKRMVPPPERLSRSATGDLKERVGAPREVRDGRKYPLLRGTAGQNEGFALIFHQ